MITSWNKFAHEMRLGRMLCEAHKQTRALGFRGHHKHGGFKGFAESQGIPLRRAYRLMQRYLTVLGIVMGEFMKDMPIGDATAVTNEGLPESELFNSFMQESIEKAASLLGIHNSVHVTDGQHPKPRPADLVVP